MTAPRPTAPPADDLEQLLAEAPRGDVFEVARAFVIRPFDQRPEADDLEQLLAAASKGDLVVVLRHFATRPYDRRLVTHHLREASRVRAAGGQR